MLSDKDESYLHSRVRGMEAHIIDPEEFLFFDRIAINISKSRKSCRLEIMVHQDYFNIRAGSYCLSSSLGSVTIRFKTPDNKAVIDSALDRLKIKLKRLEMWNESSVKGSDTELMTLKELKKLKAELSDVVDFYTNKINELLNRN